MISSTHPAGHVHTSGVTEVIEWLSTYPYFALWLGVFAHLVWVLAEVSAKVGRYVSPITFARRRPYRLLLSIVGAQAGYGIAYSQSADGISYEVAFGIGVGAEFVVDRVASVAGFRSNAASPGQESEEGDITQLAREITERKEAA